MSGLVGKGVRSYKKAIVSDSNFPALGFRNFIMAFEANAMGVGAGVPVDLTSALTVPSEMVAAGFEQPDPITIVNAQLGNFRNNVIVTSNLNGILIDRISYTLTNDSITFDDGLNANEIIVIKRGNEAVTGNRIVDARPLRASGTVDFSTIGSSPVIFEVGEGFRIAPSTVSGTGPDAIDNRQIGFVQVFADGVLQARNVGNNNESMLPASEQTGNYREVIVDGLGVLLDPQNGVTANAIEFNQFQPFSAEEGVIVISTNLIVDSPNNTGLNDQIDVVQAQVTANQTELATIPDADQNGIAEQILQVNASATAYELVTPITGVSADTRIPTPGETVFGARIEGSTGVASIISQTGINGSNENFIQSITGPNALGTGIYNITWVPGFFTEPPTVTGNESGSGPTIIATNLPTTTGVQIRGFPRGTGMTNSDFGIIVSRQGADYTAARAITTRLGDLPTS